ncbi:DUF3298 and DUF4163 domain-containing protein [Piscibacillus halophilus]|uniref:DUF3298 domain-containing protein n=1 Tax=Piscibacillus halophilus TaxID=571933 RepID=A0A1H9GRE1_9BACI|nr:DUF3298 and DUF4163 domain-containing protein [Piscibacillus halophilus]SEQ52558.1 Protein of unknown function [Piscibacillus halophilus]
MNHNAKQTVKYFVIAFIISFIIGNILSAIFSSAEEIHVDQEKDFDIVETDFDEIRLLTYETKEDLYSIKFELPFFKSEGLNNFFKGYMKRTNDQFLTVIEGNVTEERPGNLNVNLDIYESGEDLYSLVFTESEYTGGANVNETGHTWLVDLKKNRIIKQGELFKNTRKARDIIRPKVQQALLDQPDLGVFEEELDQWVNQPKYMFENMFIRDGKLVFRFDKYEITPGAAGMPEVEISIDEDIQSLFKKNWAKRLGVN